jgi:DNA polymerase (family 10)
MSKNEAVARMLEEIARMMEVLGEDSFRVNAHTRAARTVEGLSEKIEDLAKNREALLAVQGIGPKLADKIIEFCAHGTMAEHAELRGKVPAGVLALMQVPGVGPKTARAMWKEGGIETIAQLEKAIADGSILNLPRMGEKTVEKIKASIAFAKTSSARLWLGRADAVAQRFVQRLQSHPGVARVAPAGSLRRGKETIGDIDILVALKKGHEKDARNVVALFGETEGVSQVLAAGESKSSVRVALGHDTGRWKLEGKEGEADAGPSIQVDLRVLPLESWGSGLQYFTGSKEHNVRLRERALKMGYTLSDWGLFPLDDDPAPPHTRGVRAVAGATEEEIYAKLQLPYLPPEIREDKGELDLKETPRLIELSDIKAELHAHTTASDGSMEIEELAQRAKERGFHTIAVTDHSRSSVQANGLSVDCLLQHIEDVHHAREVVKGITILAGSEVDIKSDGTLDYDDHILKKLDVVVASPHVALSQDPETATKRLLAAIRHPMVHILGHPTGRLINKRAGLSPDMAQLIAAAKECHTALEINAHWMRLDLRDAHVRAGVHAGCLFAIDCDVHQPGDYDNLRYGVMTARRGWMTPDLCVNTWSARKLHEWLKSKRS